MTRQKTIDLTPLLLIGILQQIFPGEQGPNSKAVVEVTVALIAIGLSLLAGYLLQKKNKNLTQDDKPTTLATRGTFVPVVKGRRRVGPIFAWAGDRYKRREKVKGGGKGVGKSPRQDVWRESAMHVLCVGPAYALHLIEQGGNVLFRGPITSDSHPSGSLIDLGSEGSFRIFWGDIGQPVNLYLGVPTRLGVSSEWPRFCYIEWRAKNLGSAPNWPLLTYTIETRPTESPLTESEARILPTQTQNPTPIPVFSHVSGVSGVGYFSVLGEWTDVLKPNTPIELQNNTGLGGSTPFTVLRSEYELVVTATYVTPLGTEFNTYQGRTRIYLLENLSGATDDGEIYWSTVDRDDGWNGAHIIAETLFGQWPIGLGLDRSEWDMDSLEDLGILLDAGSEDLRCSAIAPDGQSAEGMLGALMQDFGVFVSIDPRTGLLKFVPIREPEGTLANISEHAILNLPEIEVRHSTFEIDRLVFSFTDEIHGFRDMTISYDNDGQVAYQEFYRARQVQIISTCYFPTAAKITERRSFEEMAGGGEIKIECGREARALLPGIPMVVYGFDEVLRLTNVHSEPESNVVTLTFMPDFYGSPLSDFITGQPNPPAVAEEVETDLLEGIIEIPEVLSGVDEITLRSVGIRAHDTITGHNLHLSRDNVTYTYAEDDTTAVAGGTLLGGVDGDYELDQGPTFTALGPDMSEVLDLSADVTSWRSGRQLAILVDETTGEQEICFLKKITHVSGSTYRLDGLIRARYDTRQRTWQAGDKVFILQSDDDDGLIQDVLLEPQVGIFVKREPTGLGTLSLSQVPESGVDLYGKGIRPVPVSGIRLSGESTLWVGNAYSLAGSAPDDDLEIIWAYSVPRSPGAGAGIFAAGAAVFDPAPEGDFLVEILDDMDDVVRSETVSVATYTYSRTDRMADFGGMEPASFQVRVTQLRSGYASDAVTATFESV